MTMLLVSGRWPKSSAHDVIRFSASIGRVRRFVHIARLVAMTHAKSIKPMKNLRTKHVGGLAGSWLSRFADCFWIKNGTRVDVCSLSFAAETMCFGGPGQPLYVHRVGAMAAAATVFSFGVGFSVFRFKNSRRRVLSKQQRAP